MNGYALSALLGLVEGLTEFLPVSSTAHIRLTQGLVFGHLDDPFWKLFAVVIQLPAILAVVVYFRVKLLKMVKSFFAPGITTAQRLRHPIVLIGLATVVTLIPVALLKHKIKHNLESITIMGIALIVGGIVMWIVDAMFGARGHPIEPALPDSAEPARTGGKIDSVHAMSPLQACWIGACQVLAGVFPGTSRSMCTIAAGQVAGLTRTAALEFSFFLSIPIMFAACAKDLKDAISPKSEDYLGHPLSRFEWTCIGIGSGVSFVVALAVIAWFMGWVRKRGFTPFAIYRIVAGVLILSFMTR